MLAGVGTTWYTWLEQGRDVRASLDVLEAICRALRLTPAERHHVLLLGRAEEPPPCKSASERVSPALRRLIENLGTNPAFVLGRRYDYLAYNRATCAVFGDSRRGAAGQAQPHLAAFHGSAQARDAARLGAQRPAARRQVSRRQCAAPRRPGVRAVDPRPAPVEP